MKPEKIESIIKSIVDKSQPIEGKPVKFVKFNRDTHVGILCWGPLRDGGKKAYVTVCVAGLREFAGEHGKLVKDRTARAISALRALVEAGEPQAV